MPRGDFIKYGASLPPVPPPLGGYAPGKPRLSLSTPIIQPKGKRMKYFIDTHDKSKGSWPSESVSGDEFIEIYSGFEKACEEVGGADLGAHVNIAQGKAYCFTKGPDADAIRRAHEKLNFPFDSITEVRRVTGVDLRPSPKSDAINPSGGTK